jgi:hypothetical protein
VIDLTEEEDKTNKAVRKKQLQDGENDKHEHDLSNAGEHLHH